MYTLVTLFGIRCEASSSSIVRIDDIYRYGNNRSFTTHFMLNPGLDNVREEIYGRWKGRNLHSKEKTRSDQKYMSGKNTLHWGSLHVRGLRMLGCVSYISSCRVTAQCNV